MFQKKKNHTWKKAKNARKAMSYKDTEGQGVGPAATAHTRAPFVRQTRGFKRPGL